MSYETAFAPALREYAEQVQEGTFGHLAPLKNKTYKASMIVAYSEYGSNGITVVRDGLPNSPWMYDAINDWLWSIRDEMKEGHVYQINVTFRNYRFWGKPIKLV